MAEIDAGLVEWALDHAKRNGATAAEVLCVSAESLAAGVRLGEVEKLKSSRERQAGHSDFRWTIFGQRFDRRAWAVRTGAVYRSYG